MNSTHNELKVRFLITSTSLESSVVSALLGVVADKTWRKGAAVHPRAHKKYEHNGWALIEEDDGSNASLEKLFDKIESRVDKAKLRELIEQHPEVEIELSVIAYIWDSAPALSLSPTQIRYLAEFGAELDIDVYPLIESRGSDPDLSPQNKH